MAINRDFYNCANCKFGKALSKENESKKKCKINATIISPNGVCSYYIWDGLEFDSRKLKVVDA